MFRNWVERIAGGWVGRCIMFRDERRCIRNTFLKRMGSPRSVLQLPISRDDTAPLHRLVPLSPAEPASLHLLPRAIPLSRTQPQIEFDTFKSTNECFRLPESAQRAPRPTSRDTHPSSRFCANDCTPGARDANCSDTPPSHRSPSPSRPRHAGDRSPSLV
jgi:hypothetical protein